MAEHCAIVALRCARLDTQKRRIAFISNDAHDSMAISLNYFVRVIRDAGRTIPVDTALPGKKRKRAAALWSAVPPKRSK